MERKTKPLSAQVKAKTSKVRAKKKEYDGDIGLTVSTGSTLLDLAISGGRVRGGGIPAGIFVEIFGPSGSGKTVMLCEIAGAVQRMQGDVMFHDPEARLNKQFAQLFDLDTDNITYTISNTVPEVFGLIRSWEPKGKSINAVFADSLAALSTSMEMDKEEGDKMGMRRAKEFSEQLRKSARIIKQENLLVICSNQVRVNQDAGPYGQKYISPGGEAIGFYSSLRLMVRKPEKIRQEKKVAGKTVKRVVGVTSQVEVFKSSVWKPHRTAPLTILFDYGVDDIRQNLQFIKDYTNNTVYSVGDMKLDRSLEASISLVEEDDDLIKQLREEVIDLWEEIESKFDSERKPKKR